MNLEKAFELVYQELPDSPFGNQIGFRKIIGLMLLMEKKFSNTLIHVIKDLDNNGVIFSNQSNNDTYKVKCLDAPDYESKLELSLWFKEIFLNVEKHLNTEIFKSISINQVQGKKN